MSFSPANAHTGAGLTEAEADALYLQLADNGVWATYVPALTASVTPPTLGVGAAQSGRWARVGDLGIACARITFGSSGTAAGSGNYRVGLPFTLAAAQIGLVGGAGIVEDSSASDVFAVVPNPIAGQAYSEMYVAQTATESSVTHAFPFAWGANDYITLTVIGEIA